MSPPFFFFFFFLRLCLANTGSSQHSPPVFKNAAWQNPPHGSDLFIKKNKKHKEDTCGKSGEKKTRYQWDLVSVGIKAHGCRCGVSPRTREQISCFSIKLRCSDAVQKRVVLNETPGVAEIFLLFLFFLLSLLLLLQFWLTAQIFAPLPPSEIGNDLPPSFFPFPILLLSPLLLRKLDPHSKASFV